jgi:salicylate hydroxylase
MAVAQAPANPLRRPEARRAFELWQTALTLEDRSGLWLGERAGYERFLRERCPPPVGFGVEDVNAGGVRALLVKPKHSDPSGPLVLHLHGGGFVFGSARASLELTGRLAAQIGGWGLTVDYRLALSTPIRRHAGVTRGRRRHGPFVHPVRLSPRVARGARARCHAPRTDARASVTER